MNKIIFFLISILLFACNTLDHSLDSNNTVTFVEEIILTDEQLPILRFSRHLQHARYANHVVTPFRNLKVDNDFTLIDDYESFMYFHRNKVAGRLPDSKGAFSYHVRQGLDYNFCLEDIINTNSTKSDPSGIRGIQDVGWRCSNMISQRFLNNPSEGIDAYKEVLIGWLGNGIIANPNRYGRILSQQMMGEWPYAISSNVPNFLTHYAIYYESYNFDEETHNRVISMGESFYREWDYYPLLTRGSGQEFTRALCDLRSRTKVVRGTNDHCGSFNARMATGGIYFGMQFGRQVAFDTGVRHLEIMLATFNDEGVYLAQAHRGICAIGYMKQFASHFELIDYAFRKAYNIDFINTKNINGVTPAQAYTKTWRMAHDPLQIVQFWNGHDQMNCSRNGLNMSQAIKLLTDHPESYQEMWNGFSEEDFILGAPLLANQEFPSVWLELQKLKLRNGNWVQQTLSGNDAMGINPYLLKLATGKVPM